MKSGPRFQAEIEIGHDGIELEVARTAQATVGAIVDAPTPPLAPMIAMTRPTGLASGAENSPQIERTTSIVPTGAIM